jgi:hypothetical protein
MNAALKLLSQHTFFQQSGGVYAWSAELSYLAGSVARGPDGVLYEAVQPSGPDLPSGPQAPAQNETFWGFFGENFIRPLPRAEWDALPASKFSDGIWYVIISPGGGGAGTG